MYVALTDLRTPAGVIPAGQAVPGAESWPTRQALENIGRLAFVVDGREAEFTETLCRGELPPEGIAPSLRTWDMAAVRCRLAGTKPPANPAPSGRRKKARDA